MEKLDRKIVEERIGVKLTKLQILSNELEAANLLLALV